MKREYKIIVQKPFKQLPINAIYVRKLAIFTITQDFEEEAATSLNTVASPVDGNITKSRQNDVDSFLRLRKTTNY